MRSTALLLLPALLACTSDPERASAESDLVGVAPAATGRPEDAQEEAPRESPQGGMTQAELEELAARISDEIADLRELDWKQPVRVEVADRETVEKYLKERMEAMDSPEEFAASERMAKILGLVPPDADLEELLVAFLDDQAGGFYDPISKGFYLMEGVDGAMAESIVAHELVHALDDQHFDLDELLIARKDDGDRAAALHAVMEGGALAIQNAWMMEFMDFEQIAAASAAAEEQSRTMLEAPEFVWKPLLGSYFAGAGFVSHPEGGGGMMGSLDADDLNAAFLDPPVSTEQVLHPELYWDREPREGPRELDIEFAPTGGFTVALEETFGELALHVLTDPERDRRGDANPMLMMQAMRFTGAATEGWGADRVVLFERETEAGLASVLLLVTLWDTERDAEEFEVALQDVRSRLADGAQAFGPGEGGADVVREGDRVVLEAWNDRAALGDARPRDWIR